MIHRLEQEKPRVTNPGIVSLLSGIIADARTLFAQELKAARAEIREDLQETKEAAILIGVGFGIAATSGIFLALAVAHLLNTIATIPLWACYAMVGTACVVVSILLFYKGKRQASEVDVMPEKTVRAAKEDMEWIKRKMKSGER